MSGKLLIIFLENIDEVAFSSSKTLLYLFISLFRTKRSKLLKALFLVLELKKYLNFN